MLLNTSDGQMLHVFFYQTTVEDFVQNVHFYIFIIMLLLVLIIPVYCGPL